MPSLSEVLAVAGATRNEFNYWYRNGHLSTRYATADVGVARDLTRANGLELAFMGVLTTHGIEPHLAKRIVAEWVRLAEAGEALGYWLRPDTAPEAQALDEDDASTRTLAELMALEEEPAGGWSADPSSHTPPRAPRALLVINRDEIVAQVDQLFPGGADE